MSGEHGISHVQRIDHGVRGRVWVRGTWVIGGMGLG